MDKERLLIYGSLSIVGIALLLFVYLLYVSKAFSYLSSDPKACINCHVMNPQYATWQHSSHARDVTCIECHLPTDNFFAKYLAKAKDGWNHSVAFTLGTYDHSIKISEDGAKRVQENCIACHASLSSTILENSEKYHNFLNPADMHERVCWDCHKSVPHGKARSLGMTPNNLGVLEVK